MTEWPVAPEEIGSVLVGSVENYIARPGGAVWGHGGEEEGEKPVDYGVVVFARVGVNHDVAAATATAGGWEWMVGVSRGVTVPREYWRRAEEYGFDDAEKRHGKMTVGEVLAANVPGLDKADWHKVLAEKSRYDLLKEAMGKVKIPWP
jgi:hypothetical protein